MYPHRIRLRGPWDAEPLHTTSGNLPTPRRMTLPCRLGEGGLLGFAGQVRFRRRFGLPRTLDEHERVWLTIDGMEGHAQITLNGIDLGPHAGSEGPLEFDVTSHLRERNELLVDIEAATDQGGLWSEVALEIRCTAFLRRVVCARAGEGVLRITGEVVGTSPNQLELYAILGRRNIAYQKVQALPKGQAFELRAEGLQIPELCEARVELVQGAVVWYEVDMLVSGHFAI